MSEAMASEHSSAADTRRGDPQHPQGVVGKPREWYDVYIYTVFVSYFEKQFFAPEEANSTIYATRSSRSRSSCGRSGRGTSAATPTGTAAGRAFRQHHADGRVLLRDRDHAHARHPRRAGARSS
jgi:hypothetical protein